MRLRPPPKAVYWAAMRRFAAVLSLVVALTACGGNDAATPTPGGPPPSASPHDRTAIPAGEAPVRILRPAEGETVAADLLIEGEARVPDNRLVVSVRTAAGVEVCAAPVGIAQTASGMASWSVRMGLRPPPQPGRLIIQAFAVARPGADLELMDEVTVQLGTGDPAILVTSPRCGETVGTAVTVEGTASVFEATVRLTARDASGEVLAESFATATQAAPGRGPFSGTLQLPAGTGGPVLIEAWSESPEDGSPEHIFGVPVYVSP